MSTVENRRLHRESLVKPRCRNLVPSRMEIWDPTDQHWYGSNRAKWLLPTAPRREILKSPARDGKTTQHHIKSRALRLWRGRHLSRPPGSGLQRLRHHLAERQPQHASARTARLSHRG